MKSLAVCVFGTGWLALCLFPCFSLSVWWLFVSNLVCFSTFLYYLCFCCDCNKCIYHSYTHSMKIYKYIWTNQYDQCLSMVVLYIMRFFVLFLSIIWTSVKLWRLDWILRVLSCRLSWAEPCWAELSGARPELNVDHWLVAVVFPLFAVLSLLWQCSDCQMFNWYLWPRFLSFF